MDISISTILGAVLPVLATMVLIVLIGSIAAFVGVHPRPRNGKARH